MAQLVLAVASFIFAGRQWQREAESAILVAETNQRRLSGVTDWSSLEDTGALVPPRAQAGRFLVSSQPWPGFLVTVPELPRAMGGLVLETLPSPMKVLLLFSSLFALLLSFDAVSGEKAQRTLGLLLSVVGSRQELLLVKFLVRTVVVLAVVAASQLVAAGVTYWMLPEFVRESSFQQVFILLLLFCLAASLLFVALGFAASCLFPEPVLSLLGGIGAWILLLVVLPGVGGGLARALVPPPSRNLFEAQAAALYTRYAQRVEEAMVAPLRRWIQEGPALQAWFEKEANRIRRELRGELSRELSTLFASYLRGEARSAAITAWAVGWLPSGLFEQALQRVAGADTASWHAYLQAVNEYAQLLGQTIENKRGAVQYVAVAEKDPYSRSRPKLDEIPSFSPPHLGSSLVSQMPRLFALVLWAVIFYAMAVFAFKKVDPR